MAGRQSLSSVRRPPNLSFPYIFEMASKPPDYQVPFTQDICRAQGSRPVVQIQSALATADPVLTLLHPDPPMKVPPTQALDFRCLFLALELQLGGLRSLTISGYSLTTQDVCLLSAGLSSNTSIEEVTLERDEIGEGEGVQALAEALCGNRKVVALRMRKNR